MEKVDIPIHKIEIMGLHGDRNIRLQFDGATKILVDENGTGKTTFLNLVTAVLEGNIHKINRYDFNSIRFEFSDGNLVVLNQSDFGFGWIDETASPIVQMLFSSYSLERIEELVYMVFRGNTARARMDSDVLFISDELGISPDALIEAIRRTPELRQVRNQIMHGNKQRTLFDYADELLKGKFERIKEYFPFRILYFPTYRLIEENMRNLGYQRRERRRPSEQLIQFGMGDVRSRWDSITEEMRKTSVQGFARINGRMLDELTEAIDPNLIDYASIENRSALNLALSRSGENISDQSKERIRHLISSGDIRDPKFVPLSYFLSNLIAIHEQQKDKDDAITEFVEVVNGYLRDKEIFYNASELDIQVLSKRSNQPMTLDKLSSGEKQIVSIFSRLYLDFRGEKQFAIFFDEPELSLSMEWQIRLLQDIVNSQHCAFLLAATHSPFMYENDLLPFSDVLEVEFVGE